MRAQRLQQAVEHTDDLHAVLPRESGLLRQRGTVMQGIEQGDDDKNSQYQTGRHRYRHLAQALTGLVQLPLGMLAQQQQQDAGGQQPYQRVRPQYDRLPAQFSLTLGSAQL